MKQGTVYIQDTNREQRIKYATAAVLLVGLWAATLLPRFDIAVLVILAAWAVLAKVVAVQAGKKGWYHKEAVWTLTDTQLTVDGLTIPRSAITRVTCIPKPGFQRKVFRCWMLNVETFEKSHRWYSQNQTNDPQPSIRSLQELARELGCDSTFFDYQ